MLEPELSDLDYLRKVELLALDVVAARDDAAITRLARALRYRHFDGDGCVEDDPVMLHLGGAAVITPDGSGNYRVGCAKLGVEPRDEGWALWYTWDNQARAHTMVTTALDTTRALLDNWVQGRDVHPAQPHQAQIAVVIRGWLGPITLSPSHANAIGLGGR